MLEDNLDKASFEEMVSLVSQTVPSDLEVYYLRNACPGCYAGNDSSTPFGVSFETHTGSTSPNPGAAVVTNDGVDYFDANLAIKSRSGMPAVSLDSLRITRDQSSQNQQVFILWNASRQGISETGLSVPEERTYQMPGIKERQSLIEFLQGR